MTSFSFAFDAMGGTSFGMEDVSSCVTRLPLYLASRRSIPVLVTRLHLPRIRLQRRSTRRPHLHHRLLRILIISLCLQWGLRADGELVELVLR